MNPTTLIVVQCRYNSVRLPGKALYPLGGRPMLSFLLKRLRHGLTDSSYHLVLATTRNREDDIITAWGFAENVPVVRGDDQDVLKRYIHCLEAHPAEAVVRVTADNPLTGPDIIGQAVAVLCSEMAEYVHCRNMPCGAGVDVFTANVLRRLDHRATEPACREHINKFILDNPRLFTIGVLDAAPALARPDLRMTIDTAEDWQRLAALFSPEEDGPWRISLEEAITRMDASHLR
jgi:spore coat polysaccharide biosynthesis protein SpsF